MITITNDYWQRENYPFFTMSVISIVFFRQYLLTWCVNFAFR